jgi:hypothetical protein
VTTLLLAVPQAYSQNMLSVNLTGDVSDTYDITQIREVLFDINVVPVEGFQIVGQPQELLIGDSVRINYSLSPADATNQRIIWESDNENIATVSESGYVTGIELGTTIITATTDDGGFSDSIELTVTDFKSVEQQSKLSLNIYPNPTSDKIYIEQAGSMELNRYEIVVSDNTGNILISAYDTESIDLSGIATGNYHITIISDGIYISQTIVKE